MACGPKRMLHSLSAPSFTPSGHPSQGELREGSESQDPSHVRSASPAIRAEGGHSRGLSGVAWLPEGDPQSPPASRGVPPTGMER